MQYEAPGCCLPLCPWPLIWIFIYLAVSKIKQFKFGVETVAGGTGHFSQVVWAASTQLGVGLATNRGKVVVVCNYDPPGNYRGRYKENVLPPAP